ncbi:S-layer protein [Nannocystaceae bacterium ST9]
MPSYDRIPTLGLCCVTWIAACTSDPASESGEDEIGTTAGDTQDTSGSDESSSEGDSGTTLDGESTDADTSTDTDTSTNTDTSTDTDSGTTGDMPACGDADEIAYALDFSTYLGGALDWEHARDAALDPAGNIVVVGGTAASDFPATPGAYDTSFNAGGNAIGPHGASDVFVAKFGGDGTLLWATFLGGPNYDRAYAVEVSDAGDVYVSGRAGPGFPVTNGVFQPEYLGNDSGFYGVQNGFLAKLSGDGGDLIWSSHVGVAHLVRDFDIDAAGNAYVVLAHQPGSVTNPLPSWFATAFAGSFQPTRNDSEESGLAKISADGTQVVWATWLGGNGVDSSIGSVRVDDQDRPYLAFYSDSTDLPATSGTTHSGGNDLFVARLASDGSQVEMGAYFGGSGNDAFETHALGLGDGHVYLAGFSNSTDLPVDANAFQSSYGGGSNDAFAAKLDLEGNLVAATYVGGTGVEATDGLSVTSTGEVLFSGETNSDDLPVSATAFQAMRGGDWDGFAIRLSPDLDILRYGSYFGGPAHDNGRGALLTEDCAMILVGASAGPGFPTQDAWQPDFAGGVDQWGNGDAYVVALSPGG